MPIPKTHLAAACTLLLAAHSAHAQEQVIKIGVTGPLSGANAFAGKDNERGVQLAIEELNAAKIKVAGKAIRFDMKSEDDQGDPKTGVVVAQKLADAGVKFVMGPYNSGVAIPASRIYNDAGMLMSTVGTNPKVTQGGYKGVFRMVPSDTQVGGSMATYTARELKLKTVGVIDDRSAFGQGIAAEFEKQAKAAGLTVAAHEFTNEKATDFAAILTKLKAKKVEAIFFGGYAAQGAPMARQMRALGLNAKLMGGDTLCSPEMGKLGGDAVGENVLCAQGGSALEKLAAGPAFAAKFQRRFNQAPDVYAATFYDQLMFIVQSMRNTNSVEAAVVGAALHASSYKGVSGAYAYDEAGNRKEASVTVYTFRKGVPVPVAGN